MVMNDRVVELVETTPVRRGLDKLDQPGRATAWHRDLGAT